MVRTKKTYVLILLLVMGVFLMMPPLPVYALNPSTSFTDVTELEVSKLKTACSNINAQLQEGLVAKGVEMVICGNSHDDSVKTEDYNAETGELSESSKTVKSIEVSFNQSYYTKLEQSTKQKVMEGILTSINKASLSQSTKTKLYNFVSGCDANTSKLVRQLSTDLNAEYGEAYFILKPWHGILGTILGCAALFTFGLLGLTIALDIAYMTIPTIQIFLGKAKKEGSDKPKFVSIEAVHAVQQSESTAGQEYHSAVSIYLGTKSKQLIVLGICLLYLVSGQIYTAIAWFMDLFSGLVDSFKDVYQR